MSISDTNISKFQSLYLKHFGKEISKEVAHEKATKLLQIMKMVYKPMSHQEMALVKKRKEVFKSKK